MRKRAPEGRRPVKSRAVIGMEAATRWKYSVGSGAYARSREGLGASLLAACFTNPFDVAVFRGRHSPIAACAKLHERYSSIEAAALLDKLAIAEVHRPIHRNAHHVDEVHDEHPVDRARYELRSDAGKVA